jgi:biotin-(acetyl-CoA carboxylase) ligase
LAVDIDEDGGLIVELESGERRVLRTGEISLRLKETSKRTER